MSTLTTTTAGTERGIRPFTIDVPEEELADLRRRVAATRWPDRETDPSQGVQLETIRALAEYWATDYDWRAFERRFAALPHFVTEIDGVDIHFIHVRSEHEDALPLIVTHGWPGSTIEQLKIIDPLTRPTGHGAPPADAFHLVIPSLPGYGFSGKPTETGWDPVRIARVQVDHRRPGAPAGEDAGRSAHGRADGGRVLEQPGAARFQHGLLPRPGARGG